MHFWSGFLLKYGEDAFVVSEKKTDIQRDNEIRRLFLLDHKAGAQIVSWNTMFSYPSVTVFF